MTPEPLDPSVDDHDDFGGLQRDLPKLIERRRAVQWMGGLSLAGLLAACGSSSEDSSVTSSTAATSDSAASSTTAATAASAAVEASPGTEIPNETAGPYPADGSNGPNVLGEEGIVRSDITSSVGSMSGSVDGALTSIQLTIVDATSGEPMPGAAVYRWHCTPGGQYSLYEVTDQNYLRGVQSADGGATAGSQATKTSQLAFPQADCETVYADSRYGDSSRNLGQISLTTDNVFSDGWEDQLATVVGAGTDDVTASLLVRV